MPSINARPNAGIAAKLARGLVAGVTAGAGAVFAMDRFQAAASPLLSSSDSERATERSADAVARGVTGRAVTEAGKPLAGQAIHHGVGIAFGAAYGVAAESTVDHHGLCANVRAGYRDRPRLSRSPCRGARRRAVKRSTREQFLCLCLASRFRRKRDNSTAGLPHDGAAFGPQSAFEPRIMR